MKTMIILPTDPATGFLKRIYNDLSNNTVLNGGVTKSKLMKHIDAQDRIIMCGHGSPLGLFSAGKFPDSPNIIDNTMVQSLRNKSNRVSYGLMPTVSFRNTD
jgi:hypothetical protein